MVPQLLSQEETLTFVKRAHERGVSVHGLLTACQLQAVGAEFDGAVKLSLSSPYNLRPRLVPPVGRGAGLFIGDARNCYLVDAKTGPWKLAAQISEDVARGARFGGAMGDGGSGDEVDLEGIYTNRVSTAMSNLGRIQFDQRTDCLHVERMFFAVGCSVLGDQIGAVVTTNGRLSWTFCAMTPTLSPHRIQRVAESMLARIRELL
jgi:hypothetical protein